MGSAPKTAGLAWRLYAPPRDKLKTGKTRKLGRIGRPSGTVSQAEGQSGGPGSRSRAAGRRAQRRTTGRRLFRSRKQTIGRFGRMGAKDAPGIEKSRAFCAKREKSALIIGR